MDRDDKIHFRILEDIARDLSGEVNFPTCLDAAILVRNGLRDPNVTLDRIARTVSIEPLIASKLLRLANSVAYNPAGAAITNVATAIGRLGFEAVRTTSLAVAMDQMMKSRHLAAFDSMSRETWEASLQVAAICRVLARRLGRVNPDEAMLCGMVHNIGIFYLLYRVAEYPEYSDNPDAVIDLVAGWHEGIGESLLHALGLPEHIVEAVRDHKRLHNAENPCNLRDMLYFANLLAGENLKWLSSKGISIDSEAHAKAKERYAALLQEAEEDIKELRAALAA